MADERFPESIPAVLVARLIRDAWDPLEVKVVLTAALLGAEKTPVQERDILAHDSLVKGTRSDGSDRDVRERCAEAVELATARGTLLLLSGDDESRWIMLGTDANHVLVRSGLTAPAAGPGLPPVGLIVERPGIFALYEQNIGLVTPIVADRLVEALERYPEVWIADAIGEAVGYNKRNWRYIQRILENWATEGRSNETHWGVVARDLDREKHLRGKYAAVFRRERN